MIDIVLEDGHLRTILWRDILTQRSMIGPWEKKARKIFSRQGDEQPPPKSSPSEPICLQINGPAVHPSGTLSLSVELLYGEASVSLLHVGCKGGCRWTRKRALGGQG